MTQPKKPTRADKQFSTKDLHLLKEGRYKEWFYQGLDPVSLAFVKAPVKTPEAPVAEPIYKHQEFAQVRGWRDDATCRDADPRIFFVEGEGVDPKREYMKPDAEWRQYCPQCPVLEQCRKLARDSESVGIFAGKLFFARNAMNGTKAVLELDETNMPKQGRPRNDSTRVMTSAERARNYRLRKKGNDRVSTA